MQLNFSCRWRRACSTSKHVETTGQYRTSPDDFYVEEHLGFELSGDGEHAVIHIQKTGQNSQWVLDELAKQLSVDRSLFGYCGLKDRHAVTRQWFSVQDPKSLLQFDEVDIPGVQILSVGRHRKKLRPGMHAENRFRLVLRDIKGQRFDADHEIFDSIERSLRNVVEKGFPNYFGSQRFGFDGGNLNKGWSLLESRRLSRHKKKSIYLSALRSFLFNKVLEARLDDLFDETIDIQEMDETGPLWGRGRASTSSIQSAYEQDVLRDWEPLCHALEYSGLNQERRDLLVMPNQLKWDWSKQGGNTSLMLSFGLPPGSYATSLIRELGEFADAAGRVDFSSINQ